MATRTKLFVMMVLEIFIWGAWLPVIFGYLPSLGFDTNQSSWILNAFTIASITAMLVSAPFADRHFAAEKFMAVSHLIGGVCMIALTWTRSFWPFFGLMLAHSLFYVPTMSVANSIAFTHIKDPKRDFGPIRMGGTLGWILAAWPLYFILAGKSGAEAVPLKANVFLIAGIASLLLAAFSLTLPHTPPRPRSSGSFAWFDAVWLLRLPFVLVLFAVTFVDAAVHQGYFVLTDSFLRERVGVADDWVMPIMSLGQVAEIGTMMILGSVLKALGWRLTMFIGVLGHAVRFAVFAWFPDHVWLVVGANLLHGVCYAFFFATVYIFVDEYFPKHTRATAQGLFNFLILGAGPFVANFVWPWVKDRYTAQQVLAPGTEGVHEVSVTSYEQVFPVLALTALAGAAFLLVFFQPPAPPEAAGTADDA
ncbi:MAG: MFS transporter [Planctomycetota bacterium]